MCGVYFPESTWETDYTIKIGLKAYSDAEATDRWARHTCGHDTCVNTGQHGKAGVPTARVQRWEFDLNFEGWSGGPQTDQRERRTCKRTGQRACCRQRRRQKGSTELRKEPGAGGGEILLRVGTSRRRVWGVGPFLLPGVHPNPVSESGLMNGGSTPQISPNVRRGQKVVVSWCSLERPQFLGSQG